MGAVQAALYRTLETAMADAQTLTRPSLALLAGLLILPGCA